MKWQFERYRIKRNGYCVNPLFERVIWEEDVPGGPLDPADPTDPNYVRLGIGPFVAGTAYRPNRDSRMLGF